MQTPQNSKNSKNLPDMEPSVGRIVWYWPGCDEPGQPQAAIITYVHSSKMIGVAVLSPSGCVRFRSSVRLCQPSDTDSVLSEHCRWMPYQQAQHEKQLAQANLPAQVPAPEVKPSEPAAKPGFHFQAGGVKSS